VRTIETTPELGEATLTSVVCPRTLAAMAPGFAGGAAGT
jgi:hypothetical protein